MSKPYQKITVLLLVVYFFVGIYLSINTGISHDEFHEQQNWEVNLNSAKEFLLTGKYESFLNYKDRYHGIGFHFLSQPIQYLFSKSVSDYLDVNNYGGILISKHIVVFLIFFISGLFFYSTIKLLFDDKKFLIISLFIYLLYPYFFGHSLLNPKDIPFLSIWVVCTYLITQLVKNLILSKKINYKLLIYLSISTSLLISIRIVGLLILLQYLIFIFIYLENYKISFFKFLKNYKKAIIFTLSSVLILTYLLNPIFWHNPLEIINSIKWMGKYKQDICTNTLGECVKALNLPANYYFIWFFFKVPILIILGFLIFPLIEKKLSKNKFNKVIIFSLLTSIGSILILFIILKVAIYNELRHVMFLIPLILIISVSNLYIFNKKLFFVLGSFLIIFFIFENISLNPYQYTWLNSFAKFYNINENFEVDYWGISNKNLNLKIIKDSKVKNFSKNNCIYGDQYSDVFLDNDNFNCFKTYSELDSAKIRPYYVIKNLKNIKRSNPKDCKLITEESYRYFLSRQKIITGSLWYCN